MSNCAAQNTTTAGHVPLPKIYVNGVLLDETLYAQELQYHRAENFGQTLKRAGQALVIRQLLLNELSKNAMGFESSDNSKSDQLSVDQENAVAALVEKNSTFDEPSEQDCIRYFENNRDRFKTESLMQVNHILLAAAKDNLNERSQVKDKAQNIIAQLKTQPELFPSLAQQYSICPSKADGGSLGQIGKGQTVPEFEKQIMRLPVGLAENPVESRYGFHVVNIDNKVAGKPLEYGMVAGKIKRYLTQKASQLSIQTYIQSLVENATIEGIEIGFADRNIVI